MSWREDLAVGILRANRLFLGSASGYLGTEVTATPAELNYLDITTLGTGAVSKAVVLDASGNYMMPDAGFFGMSADAIAGAGTGQSDAAALVDQINVVTGSNGTVGVKLPAAVDKKLVMVINTVETAILKVYPATDDAINSLSANTAISIGPGAFALFVALDDTTWYCHEMATAALTVAELSALTGITATATEINQAADVSAKVVADSATMVLTSANNGQTIIVDTTGANTIALPASATNIGFRVRFVVTASLTSGTVISAPGSDKFNGHALLGNDSDDTVVLWQANHGTSNRITLSPTTGGLPGTIVEIECIASGLYQVHMVGDSSGTEATPFSAA